MLEKRWLMISAWIVLAINCPMVLACQQTTGRTGAHSNTQSTAKGLQADETPIKAPGNKISASASLRRGTFKYGNVSGPAWNIKVKISNPTAQEIELGEMLVLLETLRDRDVFAANYIARKRAEDAPSLQKIVERYHLLWGYQIETNGFYLMPFLALSKLYPSNSSVADLFIASLSAPRAQAYEGFGYGRVSPHAERILSAELPTPVGARNEARDYVAVILPIARSVKGEAVSAAYTVCRFAVGEPRDGDTFNPVETTTYQATAAELRALAMNEQQPLWLRVFALNWFAENHSAEAADLLTRYVIDSKLPPMLQTAAAANLGVWKIKTAVPALIEVTSKTENGDLRKQTVEALGEIGDPAAIPVIRPYLNLKGGEVFIAAIEAIGKLKDAESVVKLLSFLSDKNDEDRYSAAAAALAAIGDRQAVEGLIAVMQNSKLKKEARRFAALRLGGARSAAALAPLTALANDRSAPKELRAAAISSIGETGGAEALATLRGLAEGDKDWRRDALSAMGAMKDPAATSALIELTEKQSYADQATAIAQLERRKAEEALPLLRKIVADKQESVETRRAACSALKNMRDKQSQSALLSAADDSDRYLYADALDAMTSMFGKEAWPALIASLKSRHDNVRSVAATHLREQKAGDSVTSLWQAYQQETQKQSGEEMVSALIELKFSDKSGAQFLIERLDARKNPLWFQDVRLLRHLTGEQFGPDNEWDGKPREAEFAKWRQWWATKGNLQSRGDK